MTYNQNGLKQHSLYKPPSSPEQMDDYDFLILLVHANGLDGYDPKNATLEQLWEVKGIWEERSNYSVENTIPKDIDSKLEKFFQNDEQETDFERSYKTLRYIFQQEVDISKSTWLKDNKAYQQWKKSKDPLTIS